MKSDSSHVTHKYVMKKPDGKGGWVYYYRREDGTMYSGQDKPQRNIDQWLATIRGALSRLRKQAGENPTPAQTARIERLKKEQAHVMAEKKAGKTHTADMPNPEDAAVLKPAAPAPVEAPKPASKPKAEKPRDAVDTRVVGAIKSANAASDKANKEDTTDAHHEAAMAMLEAADAHVGAADLDPEKSAHHIAQAKKFRDKARVHADRKEELRRKKSKAALADNKKWRESMYDDYHDFKPMLRHVDKGDVMVDRAAIARGEAFVARVEKEAGGAMHGETQRELEELGREVKKRVQALKQTTKGGSLLGEDGHVEGIAADAGHATNAMVSQSIRASVEKLTKEYDAIYDRLVHEQGTPGENTKAIEALRERTRALTELSIASAQKARSRAAEQIGDSWSHGAAHERTRAREREASEPISSEPRCSRAAPKQQELQHCERRLHRVSTRRGLGVQDRWRSAHLGGHGYVRRDEQQARRNPDAGEIGTRRLRSARLWQGVPRDAHPNRDVGGPSRRHAREREGLRAAHERGGSGGEGFQSEVCLRPWDAYEGACAVRHEEALRGASRVGEEDA